MKPMRRACRIGITTLTAAVLFRLFAAGVPEKLYLHFVKPHMDPFLRKQETGQDVRFSSSMEVFYPDFVESPPPLLPEYVLPAFSGEEAVDLYYGVSSSADIAALLAKPLHWKLSKEEPTVLILHTHTTESYTKQGETYQETASWRTLDPGYNMLSLGREVKRILEEAGIRAVQAENLHDYPSYSGSYIRSRQTLRDHLEEYGDIQLVLDLHRDASGAEGSQMRTKALVNGEPSAQLMVVIGTNQAAYEENLSLGLKLHVQLENQAPGIMRPLQLRPQRFNQDLSPGALLIEIGAAGNTHEEAMTAARELAKAIVALSRGTESLPSQ